MLSLFHPKKHHKEARNMESQGIKQKLILITIASIFLPQYLLGQGSDNINLVDLEYLYQGNRINIFDLRPRKQEGTFYFSDEWREGAILYKNGKVLTGHLIRYNQKDNSIEVNSNIGILTLPGYYVKEFTIQKVDHKGQIKGRSRFVNPSSFNAGGYALNIGFLQEIYSGKMSLFSAHKAELVRPDHVPILSSGSTRSRVIKRKRHFFYDGEQLVEVPKNKRKIIDFFTSYQVKADTFIKQEKINVKNEKDLVILIKWLEQ